MAEGCQSPRHVNKNLKKSIPQHPDQSPSSVLCRLCHRWYIFVRLPWVRVEFFSRVLQIPSLPQPFFVFVDPLGALVFVLFPVWSFLVRFRVLPAPAVHKRPSFHGNLPIKIHLSLITVAIHSGTPFPSVSIVGTASVLVWPLCEHKTSPLMVIRWLEQWLSPPSSNKSSRSLAGWLPIPYQELFKSYQPLSPTDRRAIVVRIALSPAAVAGFGPHQNARHRF